MDPALSPDPRKARAVMEDAIFAISRLRMSVGKLDDEIRLVNANRPSAIGSRTTRAIGLDRLHSLLALKHPGQLRHGDLRFLRRENFYHGQFSIAVFNSATAAAVGRNSGRDVPAAPDRPGPKYEPYHQPCCGRSLSARAFARAGAGDGA